MNLSSDKKELSPLLLLVKFKKNLLDTSHKFHPPGRLFSNAEKF